MSNRSVISTPAAPAAIGPYSQAIRVDKTVWVSGQIPLDPESMEIVSTDISDQARQVFMNLATIAEAAGGGLEDAVKINISLTDLADFAAVNQLMAGFFPRALPGAGLCRSGRATQGGQDRGRDDHGAARVRAIAVDPRAASAGLFIPEVTVRARHDGRPVCRYLDTRSTAGHP